MVQQGELWPSPFSNEKTTVPKARISDVKNIYLDSDINLIPGMQFT